MKILKLVLLATALLALAACRPVTREGATAAGAGDNGAGAATGAEAGSAAGDPLTGTGWTLATLNGEAPLADTEITLNFEGGRVAGTDGCNQYSTSYTVDGDRITIDPNGISTMMACPAPIMTQATAYMAALGSATTFMVDDSTLTLVDGTGATVATFAAVSSDLAGTSWNITSFNNGREAVVGVLADTMPTLTFGASGALSGTAGCNNFMGTYMSDGAGAIEISQLGSTMMACMEPEGLMDQEMQILAALPAATVYTVQGSILELRDAGGALQVRAELATGESASDAGATDAATDGAAATDTATDAAADGMAGMATVTGTVYYLPRMALPNDAMVEVSIRNAQLADAPPEMTLLAQTAFTTDGAQVPLPYTVVYAPADVQERALYSIGATIRDGAGKLLFVSTTAIPVITNGNPTENVEILVSPVQ